MSTVWHIVKKDVRRFALPLALWLLVLAVMGSTMEYRLRHGTTLTLVGVFWPIIFSATVVTYWVLNVVLAAGVVLEDPPKGTTAFWPTRPFARSQIIAAKLAFLGFLAVVPILGGLILAALAGAQGEALLLAGAGSLLSFYYVPFALAACATTAESFGRFATNTILILLGAGLAAALIAAVSLAHRMSGSVPAFAMGPTLASSRIFADQAVVFILSVGVIVWRYTCRHTRGGVAVVFVAALIPMLLPLYWRWDFIGQWRGSEFSAASTPQTAHEPDREFSVQFEPHRVNESRVLLRGSLEATSDAPNQVVVPLGLQHTRLFWPDGDETHVPGLQLLPGVPDVRYEPTALAQALSPCLVLNLPVKARIRFTVASLSAIDQQHLRRELPGLAADVSAVIRSYQLVGELPAVAGAQGSWFHRKLSITSLMPSQEGLSLRLREGYASSALADAIDAHAFLPINQPEVLALTDGAVRNVSMSTHPLATAAPIYLLINRSRQQALLPVTSASDSLETFSGYAVASKRLEFSNRVIDESWLKDATLGLVYFEPVRAVSGVVAAEPVVLQPSR